MCTYLSVGPIKEAKVFLSVATMSGAACTTTAGRIWPKNSRRIGFSFGGPRSEKNHGGMLFRPVFSTRTSMAVADFAPSTKVVFEEAIKPVPEIRFKPLLTTI